MLEARSPDSLSYAYLAQTSEPDPFTSAESVDLDGDATEGTLMAAPGGVEQSPDPGEVYVVSGEDGSVIVTLQGSADDD